VVRDFDAFWTRDSDLAQALLDLAVRQSRYGLLFGHRIPWLVHGSELPVAMDPVGCVRPTRAAEDEAHVPSGS
jgi:hypothetical protein